MRELGEPDSVARMGGEEFLLVFKGIPAARAMAIATDLVDAWRRTAPLATVSAGVSIHTAGQSPSTTYANADAALYEAKGFGRDRVVLAATAA